MVIQQQSFRFHASALYKRPLNSSDYVPYAIESPGAEAVSVCPCFVTAQTELVTPSAVELGFGTGRPKSRYENYVTTLERFSIKTLEWVGVAPIFDNGRGFFRAAKTEGELANGLFFYQPNPFEERPLLQLSLAEDLSWFDVDSLAGFEDDMAQALLLDAELARLVHPHRPRPVQAPRPARKGYPARDVASRIRVRRPS